MNSNFNQFSVNTENHSNLFHFFRTIELFLYNIYSILKIIEEEKLKETIVNSISKLVKSLVYFFHSIFDSDCLSYVIVHGEIGRILSLIILIKNFDNKIISIDEGQIIDFINKVTSKSGIFSYPCFFESSSFLLKFFFLFFSDKHSEKQQRIDHSNLQIWEHQHFCENSFQFFVSFKIVADFDSTFFTQSVD